MEPRIPPTQGREPSLLAPRTMGLAMLLWTGLVAGGFAFVTGNVAIPTVALTLAVGGLFAVVWLFVLVILVLFVAVG